MLYRMPTSFHFRLPYIVASLLCVGMVLLLTLHIENLNQEGYQNPFDVHTLKGQIQDWDQERSIGWVLSNDKLTALHLSGDMVGEHLVIGCQVQAQGYPSFHAQINGTTSFDFEAYVMRVLSCPEAVK